MTPSASSSPTASSFSAPVPAAAVSLGGPAHPLDTPELLISVLKHLNQKSLGLTSRVNKFWFDASTTARMSSVMPLERGASLGEFVWLVRRSKARPELGHYVKHSSFGKAFYAGHDAPIIKLYLQVLLPRICASVSGVAFFDVTDFNLVTQFLASVAPQCSGLQSLTVSGSVTGTRDAGLFGAQLRSLVHLKHLNLPHNFLNHFALGEMADPPMFSLTTFSSPGLLKTEREQVELLEWCLGNSRESLKKLAIVCAEDFDKVAQWIYDDFQRLEEVEVLVIDINSAVDEDALLRLRTLPELKRIKLSYITAEDSTRWSIQILYTKGSQPRLIVEHASSRFACKVRRLLGLDDE